MVSFHKHYMDLVDADGSVCIAYHVELRALGLRRRFGGIELYTPNGRREVHRACEVTRPSAGETTEIHGTLADGWFSMRHRPTETGWEPQGDPACPGLSWRVLGARANAVVDVTRSGTVRRFAGTGYSDWVEVARPSRWLGLSKVEWGRFHLPDGMFVFTHTETERGTTWQRALSIREGNRIETASVAVEGDAAAIVYRSGRTELVLSPTRVLHDGPVCDLERFPGTFERRLSEFITGPAEERRLVGRARWSTPSGGAAPGWGIAESVRFGRS